MFAFYDRNDPQVEPGGRDETKEGIASTRQIQTGTMESLQGVWPKDSRGGPRVAVHGT